jgi:protein-S-isoprenylcysteine O-methyltransferase Ste14
MTAQTPRPPWWKNTRGEWFVVFQTFLFALIAFGPGWIAVRPDLPATWRAAALVAGLALGAIGLLLALAGLWWLGDNLSALPHPKDDATLVESGPYRVVRHPIYSGLIVGAFGWALMNTSLLTLIYAAILLAFFDIKSRREERWLARKFPDYAAYQARVAKLIPLIY